jgi:hypothetical protein
MAATLQKRIVSINDCLGNIGLGTASKQSLLKIGLNYSVLGMTKEEYNKNLISFLLSEQVQHWTAGRAQGLDRHGARQIHGRQIIRNLWRYMRDAKGKSLATEAEQAARMQLIL